jgi:hypothetical protein
MAGLANRARFNGCSSISTPSSTSCEQQENPALRDKPIIVRRA